MGNDEGGAQRDQFFRECSIPLGLPTSPAILDLEIASSCPAALLQRLFECADAWRRLAIVFGETHQHADPWHAPALLRPHREWTCRRTAEARNEFAPTHR